MAAGTVDDWWAGAGVVVVTAPIGAAGDPQGRLWSDTESHPMGRVRGPLPVAALASALERVPDTVYALSAVDKSGRVADRGIVRALGWVPGTRLDVRERTSVIVVSGRR